MSAAYGFRVLGSAANPRRLVNFDKVMVAYAQADESILPELPCFLSAFSYPAEFKAHVETTGSTAGYLGPVGVPWLNFDIDRVELEEALVCTRRLVVYLVNRYDLAPEVHFSGGKGFHIAVSTGNVVEPSPETPGIARTLACRLAAQCSVEIDESVYDVVRLWRAANATHHRTGLHKIRIDAEEIETLGVDEILERATTTVPYHYHAGLPPGPRFAADWLHAFADTGRQRKERAKRPSSARTDINPLTRLLIGDPVEIQPGDRHRAIFSAAADMAEFATKEALIHATLHESACLTGIPAEDVTRQIECGIRHAQAQPDRKEAR
jgi:hypothetical protein